MALQSKRVPKDYDLAVTYLKKAHQKKNFDVTRLLSECYDNGYGVVKDKTIALELLLEISQQSRDELDWYHIGAAYSYGIGIERNLREAIFFMQMAKEFIKT